MAEYNLQLNFNPAINNVLGDQAVQATWGVGPQGSFRLIAHNVGDLEVNVVLEFAFGNHETGYIQPGDTKEIAVKCPVISGAGASPGKVTRWRAGVFGVQGNGGGEVLFGLPFEARHAVIELNVK